MIALENELKVLLEEKSYYKLLNEFNNPEPISQVNYYFDSHKWDLYNNNVTLRIREESHKYILCLKSKINSINQYKSSLEIEYEIPSHTANTIIKQNEPISTILNAASKDCLDFLQINISNINLIGNIMNKRTKMDFSQNLKLELDYSIFSGNHRSYELEVENVKSEMECNKILRFLNNLDIKYSLNDVSKYQRFIIAKKKDSTTW
jgi:uncharacterized protein YjbK